MGLLKRIENGETTVRDVYEVKKQWASGWLVGFGVGIVLITIIFYILGA